MSIDNAVYRAYVEGYANPGSSFRYATVEEATAYAVGVRGRFMPTGIDGMPGTILSFKQLEQLLNTLLENN